MSSQPDVARLYAEHAARVHRWVLRFGTVGEPEEAVHEIFVRVIENLARFRAEASPTTWLYRLTTNFCLNRLRDQGRRAELWREHAAALWAQPIADVDQETALFLRQLWRSLDDELVEVGVYYFIDAMTHAEIARIVGCSERTVGNRIERLRSAARHAATGEP
ncbi:MAG: RNA polymerase sigma factor [Deltaproteobacteria bacterium]|nr:RNA polymerase sigma factor [Nannocystaceae bacterium]